MFWFNNVASTDYLTENNVKHNILPPVSPRVLNAPGRPGAYDFGKVDVGIREISIDITIKGTSLTDFRQKVRNIAAWLNQDSLCQLRFSDEPDKYYMARLNGATDLNQILSVGQGTLKFICPNPYAYSLNMVTMTAIQNNLNVIYNGTAKTKPFFTVTFTASTSYFKIQLGSKIIQVNYNFVAGNQLVIDCARNAISVNGIFVMSALDLNSEFFDLVKGTNTFILDPTGKASVDLTFYEKWL